MRFEFGRNWQKFSGSLEIQQIQVAENSLKKMLSVESFNNLTFLDVGCGSGLFSLAANSLQAKKVVSFDIDSKSTECTKMLKAKQCPNSHWEITEGSILDTEFLKKLGKFDIVYTWGVLHHTGNMWQALENVSVLVNSGGKLFIAIYNDQGVFSKIWKTVKKIYVMLPKWLKPIYLLAIIIPFEIRYVLHNILVGKNPLDNWVKYKRNRGMKWWYDWIDWVGGYPFETAKPEEIVQFFKNKGFRIQKLNTCGKGWGNNEFVFTSTREGSV